MASSTGAKRKRNVLSIEDKVKIINRLDKGESVDSLVTFYGIGKRTVYDLKSQREKILGYASKLDSEDGCKRRKTMRSAENEKLEEAVYLWFIQKRSKGEPISGPLLCEKALLFNEKLGSSPDFKASQGWLRNFKSRHGIRELDIQGERLSGNATAAENFKISFSEFLEEENLSLDDIYNADESGLYWRSLPRKSLAAKREASAPGYKICKDRVTIMLCSNGSGTHSLPVLLLGKSKKPRCFKTANLPLIYKNQKNAWMDAHVFFDWFKNDFIPAVKAFREKEKKTGRVVLLLDNAPSHPDLEQLNTLDEDFEVKYFPPNVTALIQPMDQGVISKTKRMYKKDLLRRLLLAENDEEGVISLLKKLTLKDCSYMIADAWNSLTRENLRNAWNKLIGREDENAENDMDTLEEDIDEVVDQLFSQIPGFSECDREDAQFWLENKNDVGFQELNDDEIISTVQEEGNDEETENSNEDLYGDTEDCGPSHGEAFTALETALLWFENQEESCATQLLLLKRMRDLAARKRRENLSQKPITDFVHTFTE